jgi:hypothetical protein
MTARAGHATPRGRDRRTVWAVGIAAVCALAAVLRATALDFGLPAVYNPD